MIMIKKESFFIKAKTNKVEYKLIKESYEYQTKKWINKSDHKKSILSRKSGAASYRIKVNIRERNN